MSHKKHFAEASVNTFSGFFISMAVWMLLVGPLLKSGHLDVDNAVDGFLVTGIFTVTSLLRSYLLRWVFHVFVTGNDRRYFR